MWSRDYSVTSPSSNHMPDPSPALFWDLEIYKLSTAFNHLESIVVHYMDKIAGMFSSKTYIYFRMKKEIHKHLAWHVGE